MQILNLADNASEAVLVGAALTCAFGCIVLVPAALVIGARHWWKLKRGKYGRST